MEIILFSKNCPIIQKRTKKECFKLKLKLYRDNLAGDFFMDKIYFYPNCNVRK